MHLSMYFPSNRITLWRSNDQAILIASGLLIVGQQPTCSSPTSLTKDQSAYVMHLTVKS